MITIAAEIKKSLKVVFVCSALLLFANSLYSQEQRFTLEAEILDSEESNLTTDSDKTIQVQLTNGSEPFTYFLYDDIPWEDGKLIEESNSTHSSSYEFHQLKNGSYYVGVIDDAGISKFIKVSIN